MKKYLLIALAVLSLAFTSCTYVEPNHVGVLQDNYGRNGKRDFTLVHGKVGWLSAGQELYQVPLFEQSGEFSDAITLKASDNVEFYTRPVYTYTAMEDRAVDLVFNNKHLGMDNFLESLEDVVLEKKIKDIIREASRSYSTDSLMAAKGSLKFEKDVEAKVAEMFKIQGLSLSSFTCQLDFPKVVKEKITKRSEVQQSTSVVDQQIIEQRKLNELARLRAEQRKLDNEGITELYIKNKAVEGWVKNGCKMPEYMGSNSLPSIVLQK